MSDAMGWVFRAAADYFMALGVITFFGFSVVIIFFDGQISGLSTAWLFLPPVVFAWLRGEIVHWPKEQEAD